MEDKISLQNTRIQLKALEDFNQTIHNTNKELLDYIKVMQEYVYSSTTDEQGIINEVSDSFCSLTGYTKEELIGKSHNLIKNPEMEDSIFTDMWKTLLKEEVWEGDVESIKKDGTFFWMAVIIFPIYDINKKLIGYSALRHDITDTKELAHHAIHDGLTGLHNRRYYDEIIENELLRAKKENENFTFVMMDVDFFKLYNDTYGHQSGDEVLKKISAVLSKYLSRTGDFCFRLGGEEFGFFFTGQNYEDSFKYTQDICKAIEELQIPHLKNKISDYVTASFGVVNIDLNDTIIDEQSLYITADNQLYKSKHDGRNRVSIHSNDTLELF